MSTKDLHYRLTELTDTLLGPAPTMPIEALVARLEEALPRLKAALEKAESDEELTNEELLREFEIEFGRWEPEEVQKQKARRRLILERMKG